jgi:dTDP-4-amino-4,6-dideoxygalactose transaminase
MSKWLKLRQAQVEVYKKKLKNIGDIEFIKTLAKSKSSNHLFVIKTKKRNKLKKYLNKKKISTGIHYPLALPEVPLFKKKHFTYCAKMSAVKWSSRILSLPIGEHLRLKDIEYVSQEIAKFYKC